MNGETDPGILERAVAPWPLLAGVFCSFLACCLAGRLVSRQVVYKDFVRFHPCIAPESLLYPTACQVKALAAEQLSTDQVLVVVGSNSILHGVGQRESEVWTKKLQAHLGERYRVINLAMRGAGATVFAGVAAEMLAVAHPKVIYVTLQGLNADASEPFSGTYGYLFWDALYKGLLPRDADHEAWVDSALQVRANDASFDELQLQMEVDAVVNSRDLWTTIAVQHFSTVWNPLVRESFRKPRRKYPDTDPGAAVPFAMRYLPAHDAVNMDIVRKGVAAGEAALQGPHCQLVAALEAALPPSSRPRTLVLFCQESPHYRDRMTPDERQRSRDVFARASALVEQAGIPALTVGEDWTVDDFFDRCHISESGGVKLAAAVAPKVQILARQLGYIE